ncbi:MAG: MgtC/SapB family protein, partial [Candidatus Buchananbacteria bacterium]|nr:MgtC/SapB family protein [Candidatus Buchananbacteria bacterium]
MITDSDLILRLLLAAGLGGAIGFERERAHKVAGLRTHALVSMGAALLSLISIYLFEQYPSVNGVAGFDYHIVANIIVGIGFIGGGAILRQGPRIMGTTTAATLWLVAAVGIAVGIGFIFGAVAGATIGYLVLTVLWQVEKRLIPKMPYQRVDETELGSNDDIEGPT